MERETVEIEEQPAVVEPVEAEPAAEPPQDDSEDQGVPLTSLNQLRDHIKTLDPELALDDDALLGLKITQDINGKAWEFPIADAIRTHTQVEASDRRLAAAKEKSRALIEEATQARDTWSSQITAANAVLEALDEEINQADREIEKLRDTDRTEWAARKQEQAERRERFKAIKEKQATSIQEAQQAFETQQIEAWNAKRNEEFAKLVEIVPDFGDEEKAKALDKRLSSSLRDRGFSPEEISTTIDSRILAMAYDAMLYRESKVKTDAASKKVTKVPLMLKPGAQQPKANGADEPPDRLSILYGAAK